MEQQVVAVEAVDLLPLAHALVQALALNAVLIECQTHVRAGKPHLRDTSSRTTIPQVLNSPLIES